MLTYKCIISIWNVFLIVICINAANASRQTHSKNTAGLKLPCDPKRVEIAFPTIDDSTGRRTSGIYSEMSPRDLLHISLKWRRQKLNLILYKNTVTSPGSFSEWEDGNITYAKTIDESCLYHGYIKGQRTSYVALSTCGGLGGYIQTDLELLFIQSRLDIDPHQQNAPHLLYTCESIIREVHSSHLKSTPGAMRKRRRKRAAARTKYLEVQIVVDHKLVNAIGTKAKTETYVLALMNIANTLYQHSSLGQDIRLVVVRIIFLTKHQQRDVLTRGAALRTVNKFCKWSMDNIPRGSYMNYDISVLITDESLGPSGFAPITGLCNPIRSCAAIHDDGFTTGFVIAHEMAHVFGLFHDGQGDSCYGGRYRTSIMAAVVESKFNHFWWSDCSKRRMAQLLPYMPCINNVPTPVANHYALKATEQIQPDLGQAWSLNFQCEREFGRSYRLCQAFGSDPCAVLWCASRHNPHYCRTKRGPPLSGSRCGSDRECRNLRCQYVGSRKPVHGKWSSWSRWSDCSNECGVGLRDRTRACSNPPPMFGGDDCKGEKKIRDTCFNDECDSSTDLRAAECAVWDGLQIRYGTHKWIPFEPVNASTQCKQTCKSFYTREVVTIEVDVADGTPCSYLRNTNDICIEGKCIPVGCDGVQNSTKKMDVCSVCGGDGSQCKVIEGVYKIKPKSAYGYKKVITIPVKARNISITKMNKTEDHNLALLDVEYGLYILNGDKKQSRSEDVVLKGTMFYYKRGGRTENEIIKSPGPVNGKTDVMLFSKKRTGDVAIRFQYTVHKNDMTYEKDRFAWKFYKWSECSVTCGEGLQKIMYRCISKLSEETVDESMCSALEAPRSDEAKCTRQECTQDSYNFVMLNTYTECDAKCGEKGTKTQEYECEHYFPKTNTYKKAQMKFCSHLSSPNVKRDCKGDPCQNEERVTYEWNVPGAWSKCSSVRECGMPGHQTRVVKCITVRGNKKITEEEVNDSKCNMTAKPDITQMCPGTPCPPKVTYEWNVPGAWSKCSSVRECGMPGHQTRVVKCITVRDNKKITEEEVNDSKCNMTAKPDITQMCPGTPCPPKYQWFADKKWSNCPCGGDNTQSREVLCREVKDVNGEDVIKAVTSNYCTKSSSGEKPDTTRKCNGGPCPPTFKWVFSDIEFEACDAKCDQKGKQIAKLICQQTVIWKKDNIIEKVDHSFCKSEKTPTEISKPCSGPPCAPVYRWQATDEWTGCEAKCDLEGVQYMIHKCQKSIKSKPFLDTDEHLCSSVKKDNKTKTCKGSLCPLTWQVKEWSDCSVTCGRGRKYRTVYCGDPESEIDDLRCTNTPPSTSKRCSMKYCSEPSSTECKDMFSFCTWYSGLDVRCKEDSFLKKCCKTCEPHTKKPAARSRRRIKKTTKKKASRTKNKNKRTLKKRQKKRSKRSRRSKAYLKRQKARRLKKMKKK